MREPPSVTLGGRLPDFLMPLPVSGSLVDADVTPAVSGIGFVVPSSPPLAQAKPCDARHEVKLGRTCEAQPNRSRDNAVGADTHVVLVQDLRDGIVSTHVEHHMVDADVLGIDELVARSRVSA